MKLPHSARTFIESGRLAHLVTINKDGSPQLSVVWAGLENDELVIVHPGGYPYQKLRNIARDPRVVVSMQGEGFDDHGATPYLVVHGIARVEEGEIAARLNRYALTYVGERGRNLYADAGPDYVQGYITRITPQRLGGVGEWVEPTN